MPNLWRNERKGVNARQKTDVGFFRVYQSSMISEWIETYEEELSVLDKVQKQFNDVQGDPVDRIANK